MKLYTFLTAVLVTVSSVAASSAANASVVNFNGPYVAPGVSMGNVVAGQHGTIDAGYQPFSTVFTFPFQPPIYNVQGVVTGVLPHMTRITFNYTYSGMTSVGLDGHGSYGYTRGNTTYQGTADTNTGYVPGGVGPSHTYLATTTVGGVVSPSLPLVWSTANITSPNGGAGHGTTTIQNNSADIVNFATTFSAYLSNIVAAGGTLSYNVSAIPLPASFPLFMVLIAGMFGYTHLARQRKNALLGA